jgi:protein gp37
MSDLFHDSVPDSYILEIAEVMMSANWHVFQVLTKRHERMTNLLSSLLRPFASANHIWWGVSVEDRKHGLPRLQALKGSPAAIKFLSIEPLLEDLGPFDLTGISWVIVGGESGPGARPMQPSWVRNIHDMCRSAKVAFFFKQWGGARKSTAGRTLDGQMFSEFPTGFQSVSQFSRLPAAESTESFVPLHALSGD